MIHMWVPWADPSPAPVPADANNISPGVYGFLATLFLAITVVVIYFGIRKQLGRIHFDEDAEIPAGVKPLPKYATKDARRETAARIEAEHAAYRAASAATADDSGKDAVGEGEARAQ